MTHKQSTTINSQSGQVLILAVMLLAMVMTVVIANSFRSRTDVQLTKLKEDTQKAAAAAEAGVEKGLKLSAGADSHSYTDLALTNLQGVDLSKSTVTVTQSGGEKEFATPLIKKDDQFTFYLANYNNGTFDTQTPAFSHNLRIYYDSEGKNCQNIALELTFFVPNGQTYTVSRSLIDYGNMFTGGNKVASGPIPESEKPKSIDKTPFFCRAEAFQSPPAGAQLLVIRVLGETTKIGFESVNSDPKGNFPVQGKTIVSEAKLFSGVSKKVTVFQSNAQIPADLFTTSF